MSQRCCGSLVVDAAPFVSVSLGHNVERGTVAETCPWVELQDSARVSVYTLILWTARLYQRID